MSAARVGAAALAQPAPTAEARRLREAAEAFEALVVETLLRTMREAQLEEGLFGRGPGASIYEGMFDAHVAGSLARGSPFGVARALEESWAPHLDRVRAADRGADLKSGAPGPIGMDGQRARAKPPGSQSGEDEDDAR